MKLFKAYFLLSILWITVVSDFPAKIVETYGQPSVYTNFQNLEQNWDTCQVTCMFDDSCVMIFETSDSSCQLFQFGQITTVISSGYKMAFKLILPSCPSLNPLYTTTQDFRITNGILYTITVTYSTSTWSLTYSITTCPETTVLFMRNATTVVCIGTFPFDGPPYCKVQSEGSALCKANGGTLTGPASSDEYAVIQAQAASAYNTSNQGKNNFLVFWIDGFSISGPKYSYQFEDPTHNGVTNYQWAPGFPNFSGTGYCVYNPNALEKYVSDNYCSVGSCCSDICWRGSVCQVPATVVNL